MELARAGNSTESSRGGAVGAGGGVEKNWARTELYELEDNL